MRHGQDEPKSYLQWQSFAEAMAKSGFKQKRCDCCGLWYFQWPEEVDIFKKLKELK